MSERIERVERPSYEEFRRSWLDPGRPVVITGALDDWPARRWSFPHLAATLGDTPVSAFVLHEGNPTQDDTGFKLEAMSFRDYLQRIDVPERPPYYLRLELDGANDERLAGYQIPVYCRSRISLKKNLWVGAPGVSTILHYDMTHNLVAQLQGRRHVTVFAPDQTRHLYPYPTRTLSWHHSQVNVGAPDYARFPAYARARRVEVELDGGDLFFIPRGWWHRFATLERAIAVNFFWATARQVPAIALARAAWILRGVTT